MFFIKKLYRFLIIVILITLSFSVSASTTDGTIDASNHTALLCKNDDCSSNSQINFLTTKGAAVHITNQIVTGNIWSEDVGWINLNPTKSGVTNDGNGVLGGYAWGENAGWINFSPTKGGVSINSNGEFVGFAWAQNYGWIKFDCSVTNACVKTDWRKTSDGGGGGGGGTIIPPNKPTFCELHPTDSTCVTQTFCELNPTDPTCITLAFCTLHPTDSTCITLAFCTQHPTDSSFVTIPAKTFCELYPTDSKCIFCAQHPTDSSCIIIVGPTPTFCELHPTDPTCITLAFCTLHPTDSTCITLAFCTQHPTDPSCVTIPAKTFCELHPTDKTCVGGTSSACVGPDCNNSGNNNPIIDIINNSPLPVGVKDVINKTIEGIKKITDSISNFLKTQTGNITEKVVTTIGAITGGAISLFSGLFADPLSLSELALIPARLWGLLMVAFGLKRRNRPWGTVYDSVTKEPLDPAYVVLQDLTGNEIATSITDMDGRFGFLVPPGQYRMIASKTNYLFPSKKLLGKNKDELYQDLYFNEILDVKEGEVITKNIPMDPLKFDWNQFAKTDQHLMKFFGKRELWIARIANILFIFGFIFTIISVIFSPILFNIIILFIYILLLVLKRTILKPRAYGHIKEKITKNPLSFAILRVFFTEGDYEFIHKVTDKTGKYYCLVPNGKYYVKIEKKNEDESYTLVYTSRTIEVKKGYINERFEV